MLKFIAREVKDGACNQYSYEGELEVCVFAPTSAELTQEIERVFGAKVATSKRIDGGAWRGGICVTFTNGRWCRLGKLAASGI